MEKAIFKYNSGYGALLCSNCRVIIKTGHEFTKEEQLAMQGKTIMEPQFCKDCHTAFLDYKKDKLLNQIQNTPELLDVFKRLNNK